MTKSSKKSIGYWAIIIGVALPIVIVFLLIANPTITKRPAHKNRTVAQMHTIELAMASYHDDWGFYPEVAIPPTDSDLTASFWESFKSPSNNYYLNYEESGFAIIYTDHDGNGRFSTGDIITSFTDPFRSPWRYRTPGLRNTQSYDLWSYGRNKANDSAARATDPSTDDSDDIANWKRN